MKKIILMALMTIVCALNASAQYTSGIREGFLNNEIKWVYDGKTLAIMNITLTKDGKGHRVSIPDYNPNKQAPWVKMKFPVRSVSIGKGITRIGSYAFANCTELSEVAFAGFSMSEIGWGAFMNCSRLRTISLPQTIKKVETIAFAGCTMLSSVKIPDRCIVEDQAYVNCTGVKIIEVSPTAVVGHYAFANEVEVNGKIRHALYDGEINRLPSYINVGNANTFGLAKDAVDRYLSGNTASHSLADYDYCTSEIDSLIPMASVIRNNTYALVIGNQNYRFAPGVPYAIHDARVFREYCEKTLGIPVENIHLVEDGTKAMISEEEFQWLKGIKNRGMKKLIVYYAGHGVPDIHDSNKAYLLPTDIRGTKPSNGIALNDFYARIGDLDFSQTSIFLDACFSGINRNNESVNEGLRGTEIAAEEGTLTNGKLVVFSAAQGNETAQGCKEEGHGLFTYYLIKEIRDNYGLLSFGELADNIKNNVSRKALTMKLQKPQTPTTNVTENLADNWKQLKF